MKELVFSISCLFRKQRVTNKFDLHNQEKTYILTTKHCLYIASLIKNSLEESGIQSEIIFRRPIMGFGGGLHFVVCPQMFTFLPKYYVVYQLEQSVSSRWFSHSYFNKLKYAYKIFDYSLENIIYLENNGIEKNDIYFMPISYNSGYVNLIGKEQEEYDVLFYGDSNNERRRKYLDELSNGFNVKIISNMFGIELYKELSKAKIIVNIHYYDGALLETTRLYECLSLNKFIISETSSDIENHSDLLPCIEWVDINNIDEMKSKVDFWLRNSGLRYSKIDNNIAYLNSSFNNLFDKNFSSFLKSIN